MTGETEVEETDEPTVAPTVAPTLSSVGEIVQELQDDDDDCIECLEDSSAARICVLTYCGM